MAKIIVHDDVNVITDSVTGDVHFKCKDPTPTPTPVPAPIKIMGTIAVQNLSTDTTDAAIQQWIAATKIQCDTHVAPMWGSSVNFVFIPKGITPPLADAYAAFMDRTGEAGALAWHDVGRNGEPTIVVGTKDEANAGQSSSVGWSHEVCETIGDWNADTILKGLDPDGKPCNMFQEICDPVESSLYQISGVQVSDFVFPNWFNELPKTNAFDQLNAVSKQYQLAVGGYEELSYDNNKTWVTVQKDSKRAALHGIAGSRHTLYKKKPEDRKKSEFEVDKTWDVRVRR
jgi:hypothetical protein